MQQNYFYVQKVLRFRYRGRTKEVAKKEEKSCVAGSADRHRGGSHRADYPQGTGEVGGRVAGSLLQMLQKKEEGTASEEADTMRHEEKRGRLIDKQTGENETSLRIEKK